MVWRECSKCSGTGHIAKGEREGCMVMIEKCDHCWGKGKYKVYVEIQGGERGKRDERDSG